MRSAPFVGLVLWGSLAFACKGSGDEKASRADCTKAGEHIADLIVNHNAANPEQWWDAMHAQPGSTGLPATVTRETFTSFLDTPEGKTWMMQRRGNTRAGTQQVVDACVENASKAQVKCLLASKTKDDVVACDKKHARSAPATGSAASGSDRAPTGSGSAEIK